jgi:Rieske Fe-S protein
MTDTITGSRPRCTGCTPIDRRSFLAQSTLVALGALLAGCSTSTGPGGTGLPLVVNLLDFPALGPVGGIARVDNGSGTPVAVVHVSESSYLAFSLVCPHQGYLVAPNGSAFLCTGHGARFAADGHWIGGQPTGNLRGLPVAAGDTPGTLIVG